MPSSLPCTADTAHQGSFPLPLPAHTWRPSLTVPHYLFKLARIIYSSSIRQQPSIPGEVEH